MNLFSGYGVGWVLAILPIQVVMLTFYFAKKRPPTRQSRTFAYVLEACFFMTILDLIAYLIPAASPEGSERVEFYLYLIYNFSFVLLGWLIFRYSAEEILPSEEELSDREKGWGVFPLLLAAFCVLGAICYPEIAAFSSEGMIACSGIYVVASLFFIVRHRKGVLRQQLLRLYTCIGFMAMGTVFWQVAGEAVPKGFFGMLAVLVIYLDAQNPDRFVEGRGFIFNRRAFMTLMGEYMTRRPFWIVSIYISNYTDIRELYGGKLMDLCLASVADWLRAVFPKVYVFYLRNGHYALLSFHPMDTKRMAEMATKRFSEGWKAGDAEIFVTAGCAMVDSSAGISSVDMLISCINLAHHLQTEKNEQHPEPIFIDHSCVAKLQREYFVKQTLEKAIAEDKVCVFLQPIVDASTQRVEGAEALARLYTEETGYISPGEFIPLAEKDGSISKLGEQMFRKVCQFMSTYDIHQLGMKWININLSPLQCLNPHLADDFIRIQREYKVPANMLHLEITEESFINLSTLKNQVARMKAAGFCFVLDDYGSGYSNLMMVKQIPFSNVKLDMSLVRAHFEDPNTLLPDTIRAFLELGFSITAEGVETEHMAEALNQMDTTYLQGYHYAKPMPVGDFLDYMKKSGKEVSPGQLQTEDQQDA